MINNVVLTGRLTKDIELKATREGTSVCNFSLAVEQDYGKGEKKTNFINCQAWRAIAKLLSEYCGKGSMIGVEGSIQTRSYDNQQGQKIYVTEVLANKITFLETKKQENTNSQGYGSGTSYFDTYGGMEVKDDDLPF